MVKAPNLQQMSPLAQRVFGYERQFLKVALADSSYTGILKANLMGRVISIGVAFILHAEAVCRAVYICFLYIQDFFTSSNHHLIEEQKIQCSVAYNTSLKCFFAIFHHNLLRKLSTIRRTRPEGQPAVVLGQPLPSARRTDVPPLSLPLQPSSGDEGPSHRSNQSTYSARSTTSAPSSSRLNTFPPVNQEPDSPSLLSVAGTTIGNVLSPHLLPSPEPAQPSQPLGQAPSPAAVAPSLRPGSPLLQPSQPQELSPRQSSQHSDDFVEVDPDDFKEVNRLLRPIAPAQPKIPDTWVVLDDESVTSLLSTEMNTAQLHLVLPENPLPLLKGQDSVIMPVTGGNVGLYNVGFCQYKNKPNALGTENLMREFQVRRGNNDAPVTLFGLFDWQKDPQAADFMTTYLRSHLEQTLTAMPDSTNTSIYNAIGTAFTRLNDFYRAQSNSAKCTATVALIMFGSLWVVQLGDTRGILDNNGKPRALTNDSVPEQNLIGNGNFRLGITRISMNDIDEKSHLMIGTHGIFDVISSAQAIQCLHSNKNKEAEELALDVVDTIQQENQKSVNPEVRDRSLACMIVKIKHE